MSILLDEFDPMLKATKVVPTLEHEVSKFIKLLPATIHNKTVKLCKNNEGINIRSFKLYDDDAFSKYGFRHINDEYLFDVTVSKKNNKNEKITIFKEELRNPDNYSSLEIKHYTKEQLQNLDGNALTFCSFTKYVELEKGALQEIIFEFKLQKENDKYFVFVECAEEYELSEEFNKKFNLNKSYEIKLDDISKEENLER